MYTNGTMERKGVIVDNLIRVEAPEVAVALSQQQFVKHSCEFALKTGSVQRLSHVTMPSKKASLRVRALFDAFHCANGVVHGNTKEECESLILAGNREIGDAKAGCGPVNQSQSPRSVEIGLAVARHAMGLKYAVECADAIAAWAQNPCFRDRQAVFAARFAIYTEEAADAAKRMERCKYLARHAEEIMLMLRWCSGVGKPVSSVIVGMPYTSECVATAMQTRILKLAMERGIEVPPELYIPVRASGSLPRLYESVSASFVSMLLVKQPSPKATLVRVDNVYLRISAKSSGVEGVTGRGSFAGLLYCASSMVEDALGFVQQFPQGLPPPSAIDGGAEQLRLLNLHAVAVSAVAKHLCNCVSLYGRCVLPGTAILPVGALAWKVEMGAYPLEDICRDHYVLPCSESCVTPLNKALVTPLFVGLGQAVGAMRERHNETEQKEDAQPNDDLHTNSASEYTPTDAAYATALQMDLRLECLRVGDALAHLNSRDVAPGIQVALREVAQEVGVHISVDEAFRTLACRSAKRPRSAMESADERPSAEVVGSILRKILSVKTGNTKVCAMAKCSDACIGAICDAVAEAAGAEHSFPEVGNASPLLVLEAALAVVCKEQGRPAFVLLSKHADDGIRVYELRGGKLISASVTTLLTASGHSPVVIVAQRGSRGSYRILPQVGSFKKGVGEPAVLTP